MGATPSKILCFFKNSPSNDPHLKISARRAIFVPSGWERGDKIDTRGPKLRWGVPREVNSSRKVVKIGYPRTLGTPKGRLTFQVKKRFPNRGAFGAPPFLVKPIQESSSGHAAC